MVAFLKALVVLWMGCWSAVAASVISVSGSGSLPRDQSVKTFDIQIKILGLTEENLTTEQNGYLKRLDILFKKFDQSTPIPFSNLEETAASVSFELDADEPDTEKLDNQTHTVTIDISVRTTQSSLKDAFGASNGLSSLEVSVIYYPDPDSSSEKVDNQFTIQKNASVANEAPSGVTARGAHHSIVSSWTNKTSIAFSGDSSSASPSGVDMFVISKSLGSSLELSAKIFEKDADEDSKASSCSVNLSLDNGLECVSCEDEGAYLDVSDIKNSYGSDPAVFQVVSTTATSGKLNAKDLELNQEYVVFLAYRPNGLKFSTCLLATPVETTSMSEYYGEDDAKQSDPRCFIATAAYGTPTHEKLFYFRWFRDQVLLKSTLGQWFVNRYYDYSPPMAAFIRRHPWVARMTQWLLDPMARMIQWMHPNPVTIQHHSKDRP